MKSSRSRRVLQFGVRRAMIASLLAAGVAAAFAGCGGEGPPPPSTAAESQPPAPPQARETWEVLRIGDARVGYGRTIVRTEKHAGGEATRIEGISRMKFSRAGEEVAVGVDFGSRQTPGGQLIDFHALIAQGSTPIQQTRGRVANGELELETTTEGKTVRASIPWRPDDRGPLAAQLEMLENPLRPGQTRVVHELIPAANVVCKTEMAAKAYEPVDVLGQTHDLLRIEVTTTFPDGRRQRSTAWADRSGDVLRTHQEAMDLESFRAAKEVALAEIEVAEFDMVLGLSVNVERTLADPHATSRIRYRVHLEAGDPAEVFPAGPSQKVERIDAQTAEVTVYAVRPDRPGSAAGPPDLPGEADRLPNNLIQSDDAQIAAAAAEIAAGEEDPWQVAVALEKYVAAKISRSNYAHAFDTAAAVMQSGAGDCTEHALLLAALARARGMPARVVIGLVYTTQSGRPAFGYHMWNELCVGDRWIAMDATLGRGGIGAAHLKLAHSNLAGASAFSSFLPVAQVAGRLAIEILEVE